VFRLAIIDAHMPDMDGFDLAARMRQDPEMTGTGIVMLTSADQVGDAARCRQLDIVSYLTKPIRKSDLLSAILITLGHVDHSLQRSLMAQEKPSTAVSGLRILLVEDNPVNQTVGLRILEAFGHTIVLEDNRKKALATLANQEFDVVLMDVQMPEMDGLTATQHIRAAERETGPHITIIAMTAHAMRGDREACLAAGMDGYITKPTNWQELDATLRRSNRENTQTESDSKDNIGYQHTRPAAWDAKAALQKMGGDKKLLRDVVSIFLEETPKLISRLQEAVATQDVRAIETTAHTLKGSLGYFSDAMASQARELERIARENHLKQARRLMESFQREARALTMAVQKEMQSGSS
jgi:two-component system sensor histidine kinase/response regulator